MKPTRGTKEHDERRVELMNAAQQLFFQVGYQSVSVNDIITTVGVAKGTFYHYFKSKEDLLDQLVTQFSLQALTRAQNALKGKKLDALQKLLLFFKSFKDAKVESRDLMVLLMKTMYNDENLVFRHKIFKRNMMNLMPEFLKILKQGITENVFHIDDLEETAEMIFAMSYQSNETTTALLLELDQKPENMDKIERKIRYLERSVEKLLGAPENSIAFGGRELIELFKP